MRLRFVLERNVADRYVLFAVQAWRSFFAVFIELYGGNAVTMIPDLFNLYVILCPILLHLNDDFVPWLICSKRLHEVMEVAFLVFERNRPQLGYSLFRNGYVELLLPHAVLANL